MKEYKIGYSYDLNGVFICEEVVYLEKATGTYPCAGNVTFKKPPRIGKYEAAVWNQAKGDWDKMPDFRGMPWWNADGSFGGFVEKLGDNSKITQEPPHVEQYEKAEWLKGAWNIKIKDGWIREKDTGNVRCMTQAEKVYAGLEQAPDGWKLENGELVPKTMDEMYDEGKVTMADYNEYIRQERENEYRRTTDKIGLMVMRGEATMEEWQEAMQAIKEKYPYKAD